MYQQRLFVITLLVMSLVVSGCAPTIEQAETSTISTSILSTSTISTSTFTPTLVPTTRPTTTSTPFPIPAEPADVIFHNGRIITIEESLPLAQAIALRNGLIQAVGTSEDILAQQGPETQMIDLRGKTIMPGFVDPHTHIFNDVARYHGSSDYIQAQQLALRSGITTVGDMWVDPDFLTVMRAMDSSGQLRVRTSLYLAYATACGDLMGDWYQQFPPTREAGEMLRIGGVKLYADGGVCGSWARSYELPDVGYGDLWFTQDEMDSMVDSLDAAGYQLAIHALGDRAVEQVLNAIALVLDGQPNTLRHRIEHNATLRPDLISRYSEIGVVATIFGSYPACDVEESPPPPERINDWEWPYRDLLLANPDVHIAWHGDYPWMGPASPLLHLYSMVTNYSIFRDDRKECDDPTWWTERTFNVDEVLRMMTIEGAYALFRDEEVGSLEAGKFADLIVLSGDPTTIDPLDIKDLDVWMTMVGGNVEWCAPGHEAVCPSTPLLPSATASPGTNPVPTSSPTYLAVFQDDFSDKLQPDWTWVRGDEALWSLTSQPGFLRMVLDDGPQLRNLLLRDVDSENFQITTHLLFTPTSNFQFAGLIIYQDDGTKAQLGRAYCDLPNTCAGNGIYFDAIESGQIRVENFATETQRPDEAYLRIDKSGSLLTGYYSEDGVSWSLIGEHEVFMTDPRVGLMAGQSNVSGGVALFDNFIILEIP